MTVLEYKNAITKGLDETKQTNDSITIIRNILSACNADFPYGECQGILASLSEKNFESWVKCSYSEAQKFANTGIPTIAINTKAIIIVAPDENNLEHDTLTTDVGVVKPANSITSEEQADMMFFSYLGVRSVINKGLVYISPSNQSENTGVGNYGTEKDRMEQLAQSLSCWLNNNGVKAMVATVSKTLDERIKEAKSKNATLYLPLHSNGFDGTAQGPLTFYQNGITASKDLASTIQTNLFNLYKVTFPNAKMRAIVPDTPPNNFKELNASLISPAIGVYIEVAFHDNKDDANWIINNKAAIAENIGESIKSCM